jgi:hypothetical protein
LSRVVATGSTLSAVEFIARWMDHVPERYETRVRYYGAYATRRRVWWRRRGIVLAATPPAEPIRVEPAIDAPALRARRRRWTELLRRVFKVDVETCPRCGEAMKIVAFVTAQSTIRAMLAHLDRRRVDARAGPWAEVAAAPG